MLLDIYVNMHVQYVWKCVIKSTSYTYTIHAMFTYVHIIYPQFVYKCVIESTLYHVNSVCALTCVPVYIPDLLPTFPAAELNRFKQLLLKKEQECFILKGDLESKDQEMDDVRAAAAVSEALLKESFQDEHKQMVDEINSLKQIVKGEKSCDACPLVRPTVVVESL